MKKDTHPQYNGEVTAKCACGATFVVGSTKDGISTEICSNCHPFYTGKQKLVDTAGRVDKFRAKQAAAEAKKAKDKPADEEAEETTPEAEAPAEETPVEEVTTPVEEVKEEAPVVEETSAEEETPAEEEAPAEEEELKEAA